MPDFTLYCHRCDKEFERFAWGELEEAKMVCPTCEGKDVSILWSVSGPGEDINNIGCGCGL